MTFHRYDAAHCDMLDRGVFAAGIYRREGWEVPLGAALLELRECASRLKLQEVWTAPLQDHVLSLHNTAPPIRPPVCLSEHQGLT